MPFGTCSRWKKLRKAAETEDEIEKRCLKKKERLKYLERQNVELRTKNSLLASRSLELGRIKAENNVNPRSILLCDSANFSNYMGYIDQVLLKTEVYIFELPNIAV